MSKSAWIDFLVILIPSLLQWAILVWFARWLVVMLLTWAEGR